MPSPDDLLKDPTTPQWAKKTILTALTLDPIDAASTLEVVSKAFAERADNILAADLRNGR